MSKSLLQYRESKVSTQRLSYLIYGGKDRLERLQRLWDFIENDEIFDKSQRPFLNHTQRYITACRKIARFAEIVNNLKLTNLQDIYDAYLAVDENLPIDVHLSMFIPILNMHCNEYQKNLWLQDAMEFRIIGAYAQTELAHGSNIRGIETTATFNILTDEFIIHSPTLTSRKWWPGGLAYTATHAVVYANLLVFGVNYGPHPFMVKIRDADMNATIGVTLGDVGPKLGYNSMDNGYAMFDHVHIPRTHMLMGFAQLSGSGEYHKNKGAEKVAYGVMLDVRARIIANSAYVLARVLTIAIRYSIVRTQGFDSMGAERRVFDYPTQRRALLPLLAYTYALHFTGLSIRHAYEEYGGINMLLLSDLHASTAGLKALITFDVSEAMEACRKLCGGHGYLVSAGFVDIQMSYLPFCTLEGTKEVLYQQTAKYLVKTLLSGTCQSVNVQYLVRSQALTNCADFPESICSVSHADELIFTLLGALRLRAKTTALLVTDVLTRLLKSGIKEEEAFVACSVRLCILAEQHSKLLVAQSFSTALLALEANGKELTEDEIPTLKHLLLLHLLSNVCDDFGSFVTTKAVTLDSYFHLHNLLLQLCDDLGPPALNLIEAFAFSDKRLDSTLGRADGDVYTALIKAAADEPLNNGFGEEGQKYLKLILNKPRLSVRSLDISQQVILKKSKL